MGTLHILEIPWSLRLHTPNEVRVIVRHLPYIVVTSTDMAASCKAVELRINP